MGAQGAPCTQLWPRHGGQAGDPGSAPSVLRRHVHRCEGGSRGAGVLVSCHKAGSGGATQTSSQPASRVTAWEPPPHASTAASLGPRQPLYPLCSQSCGHPESGFPSRRVCSPQLLGLDTVLPTGRLPGVLMLAWPLGTAGWRRAPRVKKAVNLLEASGGDG